jgi:glycosyltransferase involved in cell wall biosynthesis
MENFEINAPLVSIIIPAYNVESYVHEAIESILNQTYKNIEVLIADDKSTDNTLNVIERYSHDNRVRIFINDKNLGYLYTCNNLFAEAKGEFITFQDADDWSALNRIELQVEEFNKNQKLGACGTRALGIGQDGSVKCKYNCAITDEELRLKAENGEIDFILATVMIKRAVYEKVGGYREFFSRKSGEHVDWMYLIMESFNVKNVDEYLYYYRYNPASVSHTFNADPTKFVIHHIAYELYKQRRTSGRDYLMDGDDESMNLLYRKMLQPYQIDRSLLVREYSLRNYGIGQYDKFLKYGIKAIVLSPDAFDNYKQFVKLLIFLSVPNSIKNLIKKILR